MAVNSAVTEDNSRDFKHVAWAAVDGAKCYISCLGQVAHEGCTRKRVACLLLLLRGRAAAKGAGDGRVAPLATLAADLRVHVAALLLRVA